MADAAQALALTNAITSLVTAINGMSNPSSSTATAKAPVHHLYSAAAAFDLSTRSGETAFKAISAPLDTIWNGSAEDFPTFLIALRLRAIKGHWVTTDPGDISKYGGKDIFKEFHSISKADIETAKTNRTDNRAIQNARAMFDCLQSSISGPIKATIFSQPGNIPTDEDGGFNRARN